MKKTVISTLSLLLFTGGLAIAGTETLHKIVNINTADQATLAATPGIGKTKAKAIVEYRQAHGAFKEVHDLTHVKGITEKTLQTILKRNPGEIAVAG